MNIRFIKVDPTVFLIQYKNGQIKRKGTGLAFMYFAPTTSLVAVPLASREAPFIFNETSADFQEVTVQGQVIFRVTDPERVAAVLDFSIDPKTKQYTSDDHKKLQQRVINQIQVLSRTQIQSLPMRQVLTAVNSIESHFQSQLPQIAALNELGLEIMGVSVVSIKPTPETARALEAEAREQLLREADEAIYARRNAAIEQERAIKESELNTEIAVENKQREIQETQMEAQRIINEKRILLEEEREKLVVLEADNSRRQADAQAYSISAALQALSNTDAKTLQALVQGGMDAQQLIAAAFQELAAGTERIGQLNITPDLLREVMGGQADDY